MHGRGQIVVWLACFAVLFFGFPTAQCQEHSAFASTHNDSVTAHSRNAAYDIDFGSTAVLAILLVAALVFLRQRKFQRPANVQPRLLAEKPKFWAMVVHDLRGSIHKVSLALELLERSELSASDHDSIVGARQSIENAVNLTNDLMMLALSESGKFVVKNRAVNLHELLRTIEINSTIQAHDREVRFLMQRSADVPMSVICDPFRLEQVISNLVINGLMHSKPGTVVVIVQVEGGDLQLSNDDESESPLFLRFSVQDNGSGIPEAIKERLLSPLPSVPSAGDTEDIGQGLGLYICQLLVLAMGGKIDLVTSSPRGTEIAFSIPLLTTDDK